MATDLTDRTLSCEDCQASFAFTANEQAFYLERGFREPTRCPDCRARRRAECNVELIASDDQAGNGAPSERSHGVYGGEASAPSPRSGGRFGRGFARGFSGGPQRMFPAVCASCGRETEVPFEPRGDRPVYCRECFNGRRGR